MIEQLEVKVDWIAMAMPVPTAHTMMAKRRLDEVRPLKMLIAQNLPSIVTSSQQAQFLIFVGLYFKFPALSCYQSLLLCHLRFEAKGSLYLMSVLMERMGKGRQQIS